MHRDRSAPALTILILLAACGSAEPEGGMQISFARQELLTNVATLQIYFYDSAMTCTAIRDTRPRPTAILGPYREELDDTERANGAKFATQEVPAGTYVVFVDALDAGGSPIGTGCAPGQTIYNREISPIRIVIN